MSKTKFRIGQKVIIKSQPLTVGGFREGEIVSMDYRQGHYYLGFASFDSFVKSFDTEWYNVAFYIESTNRFSSEWVHNSDLEKK